MGWVFISVLMSALVSQLVLIVPVDSSQRQMRPNPPVDGLLQEQLQLQLRVCLQTPLQGHGLQDGHGMVCSDGHSTCAPHHRHQLRDVLHHDGHVEGETVLGVVPVIRGQQGDHHDAHVQRYGGVDKVDADAQEELYPEHVVGQIGDVQESGSDDPWTRSQRLVAYDRTSLFDAFHPLIFTEGSSTTSSVRPLDPQAQGFVVAAFLQLDVQLFKPLFQYEGEVNETQFGERYCDPQNQDGHDTLQYIVLHNKANPLRVHEYIPVDLIQQVQCPPHVTGVLEVRDGSRTDREDYVQAVNGDLGDGGHGYDGRGGPRGVDVEHDLGQTRQHQERCRHAVCHTRRRLSECLGFRTTGGKRHRKKPHSSFYFDHAPYLKICSRSDPKLNQCIMESVEILRPYLVTGIPELDIPSCEPLCVPQIVINQGKGAVSVESTYNNIKLYGPTNFALKYVKLDLDNDRVRIKLSLPFLHMTADYSLDGRILMLPITGSGKSHANYMTELSTSYQERALQYNETPLSTVPADIDVSCNMLGEVINKKDGKKHFNVKDFKVKFDIGHCSLHLGDLFHGDQELGDTMNMLLNDNWKNLAEEIKPTLENTISSLLKNMSNNIYRKYSLDELLPP
uniref:Uncharacterized protein n=1 Tax=Timema bartmani TaxID=61472 RepID=A0A7R9F4Q9_9NEOP|nr:unnamed protein product [Timema bartmani]